MGVPASWGFLPRPEPALGSLSTPSALAGRTVPPQEAPLKTSPGDTGEVHKGVLRTCWRTSARLQGASGSSGGGGGCTSAGTKRGFRLWSFLVPDDQVKASFASTCPFILSFPYKNPRTW